MSSPVGASVIVLLGKLQKGLKKFATYCHAFKDTVTFLFPIRNSTRHDFYNLLRYRKLYTNYDHPYRQMIEIYEATTDIPTDAGTRMGVGDPLGV